MPEVCADCNLFSSLSHGAKESLIKIHVLPAKFLLAWLVWFLRWNAAVTVDQKRSVLSVHLRYKSDYTKLRGTSIFCRNRRDLSPEREKLLRCFCAVVVAGEWQSCYSAFRPNELLHTWKKTSCVTYPSCPYSWECWWHNNNDCSEYITFAC